MEKLLNVLLLLPLGPYFNLMLKDMLFFFKFLRQEIMIGDKSLNLNRLMFTLSANFPKDYSITADAFYVCVQGEGINISCLLLLRWSKKSKAEYRLYSGRV